MAQIVDTLVVILAMLIFAPDPEWPTAIIGIFLIMGGAFRFGRLGTLITAGVAIALFLGLSGYRAFAFGYALLPQRLAFEPAIYFITALFMAGIIWQLEAFRRRTDEETERYEALLRAQSDLGQLVMLTESGPDRLHERGVHETSSAARSTRSTTCARSTTSSPWTRARPSRRRSRHTFGARRA